MGPSEYETIDRERLLLAARNAILLGKREAIARKRQAVSSNNTDNFRRYEQVELFYDDLFKNFETYSESIEYACGH